MYNQIRTIGAEHLPQAVERVNTLNKWANENVPKLIEALKDHKILATGQLSAKDHARIEPILDTKPEHARAFVSVSPAGSLWLTADITYKVGEYSVNYYTIDEFVGQAGHSPAEYKPRPTKYTAEKIEKLIGRYAAAVDKVKDATDRADEIGYLLRPFSNK